MYQMSEAGRYARLGNQVLRATRTRRTLMGATALAVLATDGSGERRLSGAIVGKALVDGRVTLTEALNACRVVGTSSSVTTVPGGRA